MKARTSWEHTVVYVFTIGKTLPCAILLRPQLLRKFHTYSYPAIRGTDAVRKRTRVSDSHIKCGVLDRFGHRDDL